jgi:hypothetical protein
VRRDGLNYVIVNATAARDSSNRAAVDQDFSYPNRELLHEWTHVVLADSFPALPLWVNEGHRRVTSARCTPTGATVEVGRAPVYRRIRRRRGRPMPIETMLAVRNVPARSSRGRAVFRLLLPVVAIVHYCLARQRRIARKEFGLVPRQLASGWRQDAAWNDAFTATPSESLG